MSSSPGLCSAVELRLLVRRSVAMCPLAVISTQGTIGSEAALVAFTEVEELELISQKFVDSRKYANLKTNPNVAFVIGWDEGVHITVQYEGRAEELSGNAASPYLELFRRKPTPCSDTFFSMKSHGYSGLLRVGLAILIIP